MAETETPKPRWSVLYVLGGLLVALVGLVQAEVPLERAREVLDVAATLTMFGMMALWVHLNRAALDLAGAPPPAPDGVAPSRGNSSQVLERTRRRASDTT